VVAELITLGIVSGYPDGTFKPNRGVTRAEFTVLIVRALGLAPADVAVLQRFKDADRIPGWARNHIAAAVHAGIIGGYPDGTFRAGNNINRTELAVLVGRALKPQTHPESVLKFKDANLIPGWARNHIAAIVQARIIGGYPDGTFRPAKQATRAESSAIILRVLAPRRNQ
jgi:hypothetical protein